MEKISKALQTRVRQIKASATQLQTVSQEDYKREISIYSDTLTPHNVDLELKKLVIAFPAVSPDYINVLSERLIAAGFTDRRLKDAIGFIIDNFKYQKPNISDIISFDKRIKLYTHSETYRLIEKGEATWEEFEMVEVNGNKFRVKKSDKINLP